MGVVNTFCEIMYSPCIHLVFVVYLHVFDRIRQGGDGCGSERVSVRICGVSVAYLCVSESQDTGSTSERIRGLYLSVSERIWDVWSEVSASHSDTPQIRVKYALIRSDTVSEGKPPHFRGKTPPLPWVGWRPRSFVA